MTLTESGHMLPSIESDMMAQFSHDLRSTEFRSLLWTESLRVAFQKESSIKLAPGAHTLLALIGFIKNEAEEATVGVPYVNPADDALCLPFPPQQEHLRSANVLGEKIGAPVEDYISLYIWKTAGHTDAQPDMAGVCHAGALSPHSEARRGHIEKVVRETGFLRLFAADYTEERRLAEFV